MIDIRHFLSQLFFRVAWLFGFLLPGPQARVINVADSYKGVPNSEVTVYDVFTNDKVRIQLTRYRRKAAISTLKLEKSEAVLLFHGLTASSDLFVLPEQKQNLVSFLLEAGYDVFSADNRISDRFRYNYEVSDFSLDAVALYDNPAILAKLKEVSDYKQIHIIAHCVNAITISMTAAAGLLPANVASLCLNSVSLTPWVPFLTKLKITYAPRFGNFFVSNLSPRWLSEPLCSIRRIVGALVSLTHYECNLPECHMVSFMWSRSSPGLYLHENLLTETHNRVADLLGAAPYQYYANIAKFLQNNKAVGTNPNVANVQSDYLSAAASRMTQPTLLFVGDKNYVWWDSNKRMYEYMQDAGRTNFFYQELKNYGHIDPFIGKNAHEDVFPMLLEWLKTQKQPSTKKSS